MIYACFVAGKALVAYPLAIQFSPFYQIAVL